MTELQKAERDAFENWAVKYWAGRMRTTPALIRNLNGYYVQHEIQEAWVAWSARAAFEAGRSSVEKETRDRSYFALKSALKEHS